MLITLNSRNINDLASTSGMMVKFVDLAFGIHLTGIKSNQSISKSFRFGEWFNEMYRILWILHRFADSVYVVSHPIEY